MLFIHHYKVLVYFKYTVERLLKIRFGANQNLKFINCILFLRKFERTWPKLSNAASYATIHMNENPTAIVMQCSCGGYCINNSVAVIADANFNLKPLDLP
jgi:hypothetical protein